MRLLVILGFFCLSAVGYGQLKDLSTLPAYDCSLKNVMGMIGRQTIIVSPDNATGIENILADYCGSFGNNCVRKKESELMDSDFSKDILAVGIVSGFKKWDRYRVPIGVSGKGFVINNKTFNDASDGFAFVDSNRIILGGNSLQAIKDVQLALTGGHNILVMEHGKITFFGNLKGKGFDWFNLQRLKATNYNIKSSTVFSAVYVSKTFGDTINYRVLAKALESYKKEFLDIYKIGMPAKKVSWFIHSNMAEYGTMSGMFGLTCPGNGSAGFTIRGEIHTKGCDTGLVKHEYSHYLFDNAIPQENDPAFFVEGAVEYVTSINDVNILKERYKIAKQYKDTLNYVDLIVKNKDFYGQYSSQNYSVCGIFVKYIIDKFGVEAFKRFCLVGNKEQGSKEIFNVDFGELVEGYKSWINGL